MSYRNRSSRYGSKSIQTGGTVYQKGGANFEVRKHSLTRTIDIEPGTSKIIPILHYNPTETTGVAVNANSKITAQGTKTYANTGVQDGSTVKNVHLEIQIQPKTQSSSAILDFYTGRITTSFHDISGGQIFGLEKSSQDDGKATFSNETGTTPTLSEVSNTDGQDNLPVSMPMSKTMYDLGDVIKHWWRGVRKNVIYGGQPVLYDSWEKVPSKCSRSNPGMFYGIFIMNDSQIQSADDTDVLRVEIKESFTELPLVQ